MDSCFVNWVKSILFVLSVCVSECPFSKRKTARAINSKVGRDIIHRLVWPGRQVQSVCVYSLWQSRLRIFPVHIVISSVIITQAMTAGVIAGISRWSRHRRCLMSGALCCARLIWRWPRDCSTWSCFCLRSCTLTSMTTGSGTTCGRIKRSYQFKIYSTEMV